MLSGMANITDCTFRSNRVTNGPSFHAGILYFGSALSTTAPFYFTAPSFLSNLPLYSSVFPCTPLYSLFLSALVPFPSGQQGGAIELVLLSGMANITGCTFRSNRVTNGPSFGAGILSFGSALSTTAPSLSQHL
ncbi:unnamed protein product, partial [Closterium sp. Yama58-4]